MFGRVRFVEKESHRVLGKGPLRIFSFHHIYIANALLNKIKYNLYRKNAVSTWYPSYIIITTYIYIYTHTVYEIRAQR
jgi:hypothetical protein